MQFIRMSGWIGIVLIILFQVGCSKSPKIVIPSYTAPKEVAKLKKIETKDEFISKGAYLALWINPDVQGVPKKNKKLADMLINNVKSALTQTNFIALDPLEDENGVALSMQIVNYDFKKEGRMASLYLEVSFTLSRGAEEFLVKNYHKKVVRTNNPSQDQLAASAVKYVVKSFIADISPLKTYQMREFKPLPDELSAVISYAKRKDYKGAIALMKRYKGKKDKNYYYNLAILYEALASTLEDLHYLKEARINYEKAMQAGGIDDKVIVDAKARFDRFYELLYKTKKVQKNNEALIKDRNSIIQSSDSEYE